MQTRRMQRIEVAIMLGMSLGASAVYSVVQLIAAVTAAPLAAQTVSLNPSRSQREWLDATYQFLGVGFGFFMVALALYFLSGGSQNPAKLIGLDFTAKRTDTYRGLALLAIIGIPGMALYAIGRLLGITLAVEASTENWFWWTIPLLVLRALQAGLSEEVIVVAYLFTRLRQWGWNRWLVIFSTALLRGSYHLYQGFGPFIGNVAMGIVFGWCYQRWGRIMPLVIAHTIIDIVSFIGYPLAVFWWPEVFLATK